MRLITLDFETYYDSEYTLSKLTTEAYIRDPRFEAQILGYKIDDGPVATVAGKDIGPTIDKLDIPNAAVLTHHVHFDGLILSHHYGAVPKVYFDTLSMARPLHGSEVGGSLSKLLEHYKVGVTKGTYVVQAKGKHLADFTPQELAAYRDYCGTDVEGTYRLFQKMVVGFPKGELKQIDWVIRMFTEPRVYLDAELLREYLTELRGEKVRLLLQAGVHQDELMSNNLFAEALKRLGVSPPMKISPATGQATYAFAKTDAGLLALLEDEDPAVQTLVAARLNAKSTINETRAERMIGMAARGPACMYYKYAGAWQTLRLSGGDSMNWQNLTRGSPLRDAIYADEGHILVVIDSSNIEARVLDFLAMQEDAVAVYRAYDAGEGPDTYCVMASKIYQREITPDDKKERQFGKVVKLASGYQMGPYRFREAARINGVKISPSEAEQAIKIYRQTHPMVEALWGRAQTAIPMLASGQISADHRLDGHGIVQMRKGAILLPSGLSIRYPELRFDRDGGQYEKGEWSFVAGRGERTRLYGGKVVENIVQALARIIVMDQTMEIRKQYPVVMHSHDEVVLYVKEDEAEEALKFGVACMKQPPSWAPRLPVAAKGAYARRYGEAKT
jgi:DNA polymerase I-like protein with 3'-5' exonuclease and polymerase domains